MLVVHKFSFPTLSLLFCSLVISKYEFKAFKSQRATQPIEPVLWQSSPSDANSEGSWEGDTVLWEKPHGAGCRTTWPCAWVCWSGAGGHPRCRELALRVTCQAELSLLSPQLLRRCAL